GVVVYVIRDPADIKSSILALIRAEVTRPSLVIVMNPSVYIGVPVEKKIFNTIVNMTIYITGLSPFIAYRKLIPDIRKAVITNTALRSRE
ncbi:MAG TPA: hypothetical protein PLH71_07675, partial [Clostridia bacterium]|nr:hypothetical protein [Clostridia bacterium]